MSFSEIYERYARDVHRFALYLSGDPALAEDLTAETFVHALCGSSKVRVDTVKAYLFAIARNLFRDSLERRRRHVSLAKLPETADPATPADRAAEQRQYVAFALKAMQKLPDIERDALALALDEDLRYEQIAAILGCSVAAVKVRIHRARVHLRLEMERQEKLWKK